MMTKVLANYFFISTKALIRAAVGIAAIIPASQSWPCIPK